VGLYGTILKTIDEGVTWTALSPGIYASDYVFLSDYFINADTGYIAGGFVAGYGNIWKTTDGGGTWTTEPAATNFYLYSIYFPNADTGFAVGEAGTLRKSFNGGTVWDTLPNATLNDLHAIFFTSAGTAYVVGELGTILRTSNGGGYPQGINDLSGTSKLLIIYPNPSSGIVTIETPSLSAQSQLTILNVEGQNILTQQVTQSRTLIDVSNLPNGVYIVRIVSDGITGEGKFVKK
jgi:hypothetical protein